MKKSKFRKVIYFHKNEYMAEPKLKPICYLNQSPNLTIKHTKDGAGQGVH